MYVITPLYNQVEARSDSELTLYARTLETDYIYFARSYLQPGFSFALILKRTYIEAFITKIIQLFLFLLKNTVFILFPAYIFGAVWSIKKQSFKRALAFIRTIFASGILNTNTVSAISSSEYHCLHFANLIVLINLYTKEILPVRKIPLKSIAHFPELVSHSFPLSIIELKITALPLTYKHTVFILSCVAFNITWYN